MRTNEMRPLVGFLIAFSFCARSYAVPVIDVGTISLLENTPDQTVPIYVSGGDAIQGLNLNLSVESGGPELSADGKLGPMITAVDVVTDTLFANNNDGQTTIASFPQAWVITTATSTGSVAADGLLTRVTFDTTGFLMGSGPFLFTLTDPLGTPTDFAGIAADLTIGQIEIVPEPQCAPMLLIGIVGWALRHRRRTS